MGKSSKIVDIDADFLCIISVLQVAGRPVRVRHSSRFW